VVPSADIRGAVCAFLVADRDFGDAEAYLPGAKEQVEVAEGVKLTEVASTGGEPEVVAPEQDLGAAEGILHRLPQHPGEDHAERLVGTEVQEAHRLPLQRVDEPHPVGELGLA